MKVVYVGDNRNRGNFGCRATSTALSQIIERNNIIVGTITGRYTNNDTGELFFYKYLPAGVYKWLGKKKRWSQLKSAFYLFIRLIRLGRQYIFSNFDYLCEDNIEESLSNFIKCLPANPQLNEFDLRNYDFDALIVNGEGSFIFRVPAWRESVNELMLMYWALKMGKKVYYMNGMLSDDPFTKRNDAFIKVAKPIFENAEILGVREDYSLKYANEQFPNANIKEFPDALFTWYDMINDGFKVPNGKYVMGMTGASNSSFTKYDFTKPYILVSGSSSIGKATNDIEEAISIYSKLVEEIRNSFQQKVFLIEVCEGDSFLRTVGERTKTDVIAIDTPILAAAKILANADVYISGRYHPAILASQGGTPCVFMSSNSHKTISLQELLNYKKVHEYYVLPSDTEIQEMISDAKDAISQGQSLREDIKQRAAVLSRLANQMEEIIK
ncbi:polysaccharide pyruvyl transferase family protein [Bacteroides sp. AN502(2024)]|uniref:polysaccharide pyruvyl transferase family protein n=1 Tax=Bacteroides sp. AN502(2024) TaxID=3160599 RepID=UPI003512FAA7